MGQPPWPICARPAGWRISGSFHLQLCFWFSQRCCLPSSVQRRLDPLDLQRLCLSWRDVACLGLHGHVGPGTTLCQRSLHSLLFRKNEDNKETGAWGGRCKRPGRSLFVRLQGPWLPLVAGGPSPWWSLFFSSAFWGRDWPSLSSGWKLELPSMENWQQCWRRRECDLHQRAAGSKKFKSKWEMFVHRRMDWHSWRTQKPRWSWRQTYPRCTYCPI